MTKYEERVNMYAILKSIPKQPQRQDDLIYQINYLYMFANRLGLYDAADLINRTWLQIKFAQNHDDSSKISEWIDCKETPAPYGKWIWISAEDYVILAYRHEHAKEDKEQWLEAYSEPNFIKGKWLVGEWHFGNFQNPTHWMPLPEPPK